MTPYEKALSMYEGNEVGSMMAYCARYGVVFADLECFLCAYPTHHSLLKEKNLKKVIDKPDTWYVCIGVGSKNILMSLVEPLDFVAYRRFDDNVRLIKWERLWATNLKVHGRNSHQQE